MKRKLKIVIKAVFLLFSGFILGVFLLYIHHAINLPDLDIWHTVKLSAEMTSEDIDRMTGLQEYLEREQLIFRQLDEQVYQNRSERSTGPLDRFLRGSWSDPQSREPNWNQTITLSCPFPRANVLMLHGLSDSPYSLRALAKNLHGDGCAVTVLRLPGHGTMPSGLTTVQWQDFTAAARLAASDLTRNSSLETPFYIVGYSNGAALAVEYTLAAMLGEHIHRPDGLFIISPALSVSPTAVLAKWNLLLAHLPGLEKLAWLSIEPEYDPYKYNSFSINAGKQIYALTRHIQNQIRKLDRGDGLEGFPPVLALISVVDATIPPQGLIDRFMMRLTPNNHKLLLFDVNRVADDMALLKDGSRAMIEDMMNRKLPFAVSLLTNREERDRRVELREKQAMQTLVHRTQTQLSWPVGVYSLSHIALPFPPEDSIYGIKPGNSFSLGCLEPRGEKNVLLIPASSVLRLRSNPFYEIVEQHIRSRIVSD